MHRPSTIPAWKRNPFTRLLSPLAAGILLQWYLEFSWSFIFTTSFFLLGVYVIFRLLPLAFKFRLKWVQGLLLNFLLLNAGALVTWQQDIRHSKNWYGHFYRDGDRLVVSIRAPLEEKAKSFKASGYVEAIIRNKQVIQCKGNLLLYFSKDTTGKTGAPMSSLQYGDQVIVRKPLQRIKNAGNPGAFNYERYAAFQQLFHNVFLNDQDWVKTPHHQPGWFKQLLYATRAHVLQVLRKYMDTKKDVAGIAEALLIGYTNDLDKDLVQAYSNTGVVHIIAISGMHLGLIYLLLIAVFSKIPLLNKYKFLQAVFILACLWLFSLLTGGSASVLRAAVMFSFITIGANLNKSSSIYNSLAAAAFVLLCYNPYFLWDVGFQLSFLAVVSIIIFQRPIYNCWYIQNKWADKIWKLAAVSLAAQVLTFPVCIYYFHQFPNLFLFTNIVVVPLSGLILYAEIALIAFSWVEIAAPWIGKLVSLLVAAMNRFVLWVNGFPYAVWDGLAATALSTWLLYGIVIASSAWLLNRERWFLKPGLTCLLAFSILHAYDLWQVQQQQKIVVYNIPHQRAIDFIRGNAFTFIGDSILLRNGVLQNFHLKPARISQQLTTPRAVIKNLFHQGAFWQFNDTRIILIDSAFRFEATREKIRVNFILLSKNPPLHIADLAGILDCDLYIFDASNSLWKIGKWQKECEELHLRSYSVPEKGAFIADVTQ